MKTIITPALRLVGTAALALAASQTLSAAVESIITPGKRVEVLESSRQLLSKKDIAAKQPNPFFSQTFNDIRYGTSDEAAPPDKGTTQPSGPRNNRDLLQSIATSIKPSGYFVIGGEPTLVFGQKRVKAGGTLTITFEGKEYTLEVTALDRTNFTLRLNREEFTRPIK